MNPVGASEQIRHYLLASDFDQTLSFNDSGLALAEMIGVRDFEEKVASLSRTHLVQQGAELAYLLRHDPEFRVVRREHLIEVGKHIRLKKNVDLLAEFLHSEFDQNRFSFYVISAAPREVVQSALAGLVPPGNIVGTEFEFDSATGEITSIVRVPAGYGKVIALNEIETRLQIRPDRTIYVGDGSSDLYVMQHLNSRDGYTIAVSKVQYVARIARRSVLSDNALSVLVPVFEDILRWDSPRIREFFSSYGLTLQGWDKVRTDLLTFHEAAAPAGSASRLTA